MSAIGEFDVAASPLQMAMVTAVIANDGVVMDPYMVDMVRARTCMSPARPDPQQQSVAMSSENAAALREMMVSWWSRAPGSGAQIPGVDVGGKTGTAHSDNDRRPYAWFTAWADDPKVAVCVFVEDAEIPATDIAGGRVAAPIAKAVIEALR